MQGEIVSSRCFLFIEKKSYNIQKDFYHPTVTEFTKGVRSIPDGFCVIRTSNLSYTSTSDPIKFDHIEVNEGSPPPYDPQN